MTDSVFASAAARAAFADDVLEYLRSEYMLDDDTLIQGQSLTYLQNCLRSPCGGRRWRLGGGYWGITNALHEAGFKIVRARTMRYTRKGERKPYAECDCVTL